MALDEPESLLDLVWVDDEYTYRPMDLHLHNIGCTAPLISST
jgi:hypothetical protein